MSVTEIFDNMEYGPAIESAKAAQDWLDSHDRSFDLFVAGKWQKASGGSFKSTNPANGEFLADIGLGNAGDIDKAVKAASKAMGKWQSLSCHARAKYLYALARLVQKHARILAVLETLDNGKPIRESRDIDIPLVARHFYHHAGWAQLLDDEFAGFKPLGVVGQIIPWNFPLLMLAWKIAPALAAGNVVVLKPAEYTPLTALYFCELCQKAGIPEGVINIVTGDGETGKALVAHQAISKIAFTGSSEVGKYITRETAGTGKQLTLELGGKSPFILFDDADIDSAIEGIVDAIWFNQGEVCCAGSRLLVQEGIAETVYAKLRQRMSKLRIGNPLDKTIDIGALADEVQLHQVQAMVDQGVDEGASLWQPDITLPNSGCYIRPGLLTDIDPASTLVQEEIFGPFLVAMSFRTPSEAIALANNSKYGLAASIWSENINTALDMAAEVKAGVVWINSTNQFDAACGFGGFRQSGYGREGGREGMYSCLKPSGLKAKKLGIFKPAKLKTTSPKPGQIDRTAKHYIGGKQCRADNGQSIPVINADGSLAGEVADGSRKDIRNAVEAATRATGWSRATAHLRAQIIYYIAENLQIRADELANRIRTMTGTSAKKASREVEQSIETIFTCAAWADKYDGAVHSPPVRNVAIAMNEPLGVLGIVAPQDNPLLGLVSLIFPAIATGNRVVVIPSDIHPLAATDFYQVLETSDLPAGVVNIVTGEQCALAKTLSQHDEVSGIWYFGNPQAVKTVQYEAAANLKQIWTHDGFETDWQSADIRQFLRKATQVKNIWIPYGA